MQIPLSIVEAIACGLPAVSTKFEGLPLLFPEGYQGIIYVDEIDMLPAKVNETLSSFVKPEPEKLVRLDWKNIGKELREFYESIL